MVMLKQRGVDCVCRLTSHRAADFRRGQRLGPGDHVVKWLKPRKPRSLDQKTYDLLPEFLLVRESRVRVEQAGFRTTTLIIATTLLDAAEFAKGDLAQLYRARWNAELDLRSLKRTLQMDVLRGKTPDLVRKEVWAHVLAYNLVRTVMTQAAARHDVEPRSISFKGAVQTLQAFQPVIAMLAEGDPGFCRLVYQQVLDAIATHRVADRPDRFEPRLRKRRPKHYAFLRKPRREVKRQMLKRPRKI
jgi:Transposase DDE domain